MKKKTRVKVARTCRLCTVIIFFAGVTAGALFLYNVALANRDLIIYTKGRVDGSKDCKQEKTSMPYEASEGLTLAKSQDTMYIRRSRAIPAR